VLDEAPDLVHASSCPKNPLRLALAEARAEVDLERQKHHAQIAMTVARLGGEVEGHPTHAGNYLQRVDELRAAESQRDRAVAVANRMVSLLRSQEPDDDSRGDDGSRHSDVEMDESAWRTVDDAAAALAALLKEGTP
jgi:hypothetical protein